MADWLSLFAVYRTVVIRDDEIVQGVLHPELGPDHPVVRSALEKWGGTHFVYRTDEGTEITLVRPLSEPPPERWWLHFLLGVLTLLTTTTAGAYFVGRDPFDLAWLPLGPFGLPVPSRLFPEELLPGLGFSVPVLAILLGHELGHFLVARRSGMRVSPPYFIPAPHWVNVIGTFGAFIRLRSPVINRRVLLDIGAAGPLVSFFLSIPAALIGLSMSSPLPEMLSTEPPSKYVVLFGNQPIWLGDSLLFGLMDGLLRNEGAFVLLHPLAFAAWLGLFVTALNLFPLAQLDGGHILYALLGPRQRWFGVAFLGVLIGLGFFWWGWWLWAGLILVLGRGTTRHPSVFDPTVPVTGRRRAVGWFCVLIFILTFVAIPIRL